MQTRTFRPEKLIAFQLMGQIMISAPFSHGKHILRPIAKTFRSGAQVCTYVFNKVFCLLTTTELLSRFLHLLCKYKADFVRLNGLEARTAYHQNAHLSAHLLVIMNSTKNSKKGQITLIENLSKGNKACIIPLF